MDVAPDSWAENGGSRGRMVVTQYHLLVINTEPVQRDVKELLDRLRQAGTGKAP